MKKGGSFFKRSICFFLSTIVLLGLIGCTDSGEYSANIYELSESEQKLVTNPSVEYVVSVLSQVDTITEVELNPHPDEEYVAQVFFTSNLVDQSGFSEKDSAYEKGTDAGGSIDIFQTTDEAIERDKYLHGFDNSILLNSGSHAVVGTLVIRTSHKLDESTQKSLTDSIVNVLISGDVKVTDTSKVTDNSTSDTTDLNTDTSSKKETSQSSNDSTTSNSNREPVSTSDSKPNTDTNNTVSGVGAGKREPVNLSSVPAYSGNPYVVVNNNIPNFSASELKSTGYETYSNLDSLGRTQMAIASVGKDTMPGANEERGSISSIKPTGWIQATYDSVSGKYLYNRCHLIGWQLSAENANKKNLITGTKYLNINGMLPFENMVADYIKETGNHVAYRITPIYQGNNLLASGVQMEAYSVEDKGAGICFNVYCYNVQPGITINYADGTSSGPSNSGSSSASTNTNSGSASSTTTNSASSSANITQDSASQTVYITKTGKKYHSSKNCPGLSNAKAIYDSTLSEAKNKGLEACSKCH